MRTEKVFFLANRRAGTGTDNKGAINEYCVKNGIDHLVYALEKGCNIEQIKRQLSEYRPTRLVAVGGDGTLKLLAESGLDLKVPIGIIPAGSANGMAKELNIPMDFPRALHLACNGKPTTIHATKVNGQLCIHLADIGFNAYVVKKFDELPTRGMWTYAKAAWSAFWNHRKMRVELMLGGKTVKQQVAMVVIANATKYGTGLQINPNGKLTDGVFEVILVKEYAVMEILKVWVSRVAFNPKKIEVLQTDAIKIATKHGAHFQIDGEYLGKITRLEAEILPRALKVITGENRV